MPTDEEAFVAVSEDDEEATASAKFEDDEEFIDELSEDTGDDDIDTDDAENGLTENDE